jgi:hypothetical protein
MRVLGAVLVAAIVGIDPASALARSKHSHTHVRDHRHSDSSHDSGGSHHHSSGGGGWASLLLDAAVAVAESSGSNGDAEPAEPSSAPNWIFEVGGIGRRFRGPSFYRTGTLDSNGTSSDYTVTSAGSRPGDTAAAGMDLRALVPVTDNFYMGAELELGGLVRSPIQLMDSSTSDLRIASRMMIGSATVAGARIRSGIAELDGELAGGVRIISTSISRIDAKDDEDADSASESKVDPLLEARVRGALWVAPRVYIAGQLGVSALDRSDVNVAFSVGFSGEPFGRR